MKSILGIVVLVILVCGCSGRRTDTENEITRIQYDDWTDSYFENAKFVFASNYCEEDTLYIVSSSLKEYESLFDESLISKHQDIRYDFVLLREYQCIPGSASVNFIGDSICITLNLEGLEFKSSGFAETDYSTFGSDFNIFGRTVKDCVIVDSDANDYKITRDKTSNKIIRYVFNKKYGLIYYQFENGEEFYRRDIFESWGEGTSIINSQTDLHKSKLEAIIPST